MNVQIIMLYTLFSHACHTCKLLPTSDLTTKNLKQYGNAYIHTYVRTYVRTYTYTSTYYIDK